MSIGDHFRNKYEQSTAELFDRTKTGVFICTQAKKIGCWNVNKLEVQGLVFPNDPKPDRNGNLQILSEQIPLFFYKQLDPEEFYYRARFRNMAAVICVNVIQITRKENMKTFSD